MVKQIDVQIFAPAVATKNTFCFEVTGAFSAILLVHYLMDQASKLLLVKLILVMSSCILMHSEAACLLA
jgi:hypothetical protein